MTRYSYAQLEQLWINAGGARSLAPVAAAIAEAESGGDSAALNETDNNGTQTSVGLWQVSNGTHSYPQSWRTPAGNAAEAVAKYKGAGGWSPWGTYDSGAYKAFLNGATTPDPNVPSDGGTAATLTGASGDPTLGGTCVGTTFPHTSWCLKKTAARHAAGIALMVAGGLVALPGVLVLVAFSFKASGAQRAVRQVAGVLPAPAGRAAEAAVRRAPAARVPSAQPPRPAPRPGPSDLERARERAVTEPVGDRRAIAERRAARR